MVANSKLVFRHSISHILSDNQTYIYTFFWGGGSVHIKNIMQPVVQQAIKFVVV